MHGICPAEDELGLFTDLYELSMMQAYQAERMHEEAVFSLFFRRLPANRNFMLACGQQHAASLATRIRFPPGQLHRLAGLDLFQDDFLRWLQDFRFTGDIHALEEGTPVFPHEPLLEVCAPVAQGQLLESLLMNYVNTETLLASKAARITLAADGRGVLDFGMRRMHGMDAAMRGVRAYRVAGLQGTSNVLGGLVYGLPPRGTMAHSFIQAHDSELDALRAFARLYPGTTLLVDTYDTLAAVDKVVQLVRDEGLQVGGIRLDSGDLGALARRARQRLDQAGLQGVKIVASGSLDEWKIHELLSAEAPIDGFGVGTAMGAVEDAPSMDLAYKLTEYAGEPRLKSSPGKQILPGRKQVWRYQDGQGRYTRDEITRRHEHREATPLLHPVVASGEPVGPAPDTGDARHRAWTALERMPRELRQLQTMEPGYGVSFSEALTDLRAQALAALV